MLSLRRISNKSVFSASTSTTTNATHSLTSSLVGPRYLATLPAYAFDPIAKAPTKKYPLKALGKQVTVSQLENKGLHLASMDDQQAPISSLSLVLQAGPRFQSGLAQQGVAQWIQAYGFKVRRMEGVSCVPSHLISSYSGCLPIALATDTAPRTTTTTTSTTNSRTTITGTAADTTTTTTTTADTLTNTSTPFLQPHT